MRKAKADVMAQASADWFHRGLIPLALSRHLAERYDRHDAFLSNVGRWLGIFAILLIASGVFTLIGSSSESTALIGALLIISAIATWFTGIKLATGPTTPMPITGVTLVTLAFVLFFAGCGTILAFGSYEQIAFITLLFLCAALAAATAYGFSLRWPLFLAALFLFHGVGSWGAYVGHGGYVFSIQHPPSMALIAALVALLGIAHRQLEDGQLARYCGFGHIMIVIGLFYMNQSLWVMSLGWRWSPDEMRVLWTLAFAAVALGEIVLGAFLKDSLFTGYGVVFLAINLYTQLFEHFWNKLSLALFLTIVGLIGLAIGFGFEMLYRRQAPRLEEPTP